jgi:hypothetical protein
MEIKIKGKIILLILVFINIFCTLNLFVYAQSANQNFLKHTYVKLKGDTYLKFIFIDDNKYQIKWGNNNYSNITKDTFKIQGDGLLSIYKSNKKAIVLKQGCGTSCNYCIILPLKEGSQDKKYYNLVALSMEDNLVAYCVDSSLIKIENYLNGKQIIFYTNDLCPAAINIECIDKAYFKGKELIIYWQGKNWKENKKDKKSMKVFVDF